MGLRVYLQNNEGETTYIDYGLEGRNYKNIIRTEIREDSSQVKTFSGSKWVGIPEIDEQEALKELVVETPKSYKVFNMREDDTKNKVYWVSALCTNCNQSQQISIPLKTKVNKNLINSMTCPRCKVPRSLRHAVWNGIKYVIKGVSK